MFGFEEARLSLSFSPLFFIAALIILGFYTYFVYRYTVPPVTPGKKFLLSFLRFTALLLILFIIFEPVLTLTDKKIVEPVNLFFIDNSRSVKIDDGTAREEKVKSFIEEAEENAAAFSEFLTFGSAVNKVNNDSLSYINFSEGTTNFSEILSYVRNSDRNIASAVIISDGVITEGSNPVFNAEELNIPFFTLGIGDTSGRNDIEIGSMLYNEYIYAGTPTVISADILNSGFQSKQVTAAFYEDDRLVERKEVQLGDVDNVNFNYTPQSGGEKKLTVTVTELEGEFTYANNKKIAYVNVLDSKFDVLIISGFPSSDLSFIKNSLELDENIKVGSITQIGSDKYIESGNNKEKIDSADILFLLNFPTAQTGSALLRQTADAITNRKKPFFITFSEYTDHVKLKAFENELGFSIGRFSQRLNEVLPDIVKSYGDHPLLKNESGNSASAWNRLPPVLQPDAEFRIKPESEVLAEIKVNNVPVNSPLILTRRIGGKRSIAVLAKNIWRWKLQNTVREADPFDSFIHNSVKWLNTSEDQRQVTINTTKKVFPAGEEAEFIAQVYDQSFNPLADAEVQVTIDGKDGKYELQLNSVGGGLYEGIFQPPSSGDYTFSGTASADGREIGKDNGKFNVGELDVEMTTPEMNKTMLAGLASVTGGEFYTSGEHDELFDSLRRLNEQSSKELTEIKELKLWSDEWLLMIVILIMGVEWFLRKRSGML